MSLHYRNYIWKEGIPYGVNSCSAEGITYKIPMDPYRKFISIERYNSGKFEKVVYDSTLLDFRHLKPEKQVAWERVVISETVSEIRNQDDRLLYFEHYSFQDSLCRECLVMSVHGMLLSTHRMLYKALGDDFNGVILLDTQGQQVMVKSYEIDEEGQFTKLLKEDWAIKDLFI